MNHLQQAQQFRKVYQQPVRANGLAFFRSDDPLFLTMKMQIGCIQEEEKELIEAISSWVLVSDGGNASARALSEKTNVAKELADLIYTCYQLAAFLRLDIDQVLDRVHKSNMSKLDEKGKPIFNKAGKVMKGPHYAPPCLDGLV